MRILSLIRAARIYYAAVIISLLLWIDTTTLWLYSYHAKWHRLDIAGREVHNDLDANGQPIIIEERYRGILFDQGYIISYTYGSATDIGPTSGWEFNSSVDGRNLGEPGSWLWKQNETDAFGDPNTYVEIGVRAFLVSALFSMLPAAWLIRKLHRRRCPVLAGRCHQCGYDLRASPDYCPECGTRTALKSDVQPSLTTPVP